MDDSPTVLVWRSPSPAAGRGSSSHLYEEVIQVESTLSLLVVAPFGCLAFLALLVFLRPSATSSIVRVIEAFRPLVRRQPSALTSPRLGTRSRTEPEAGAPTNLE